MLDTGQGLLKDNYNDSPKTFVCKTMKIVFEIFMCVLYYMNVLEWLFEHFCVSLSDVQYYTSDMVVQLIRLSLRHCRLGEKRYRPLIPCSRGRLLCSTKHRTEIVFAYYIVRLLQHVKGMGPLLYYNGPFCEQKSKRGINCLSLRGLQLTE